MNTLAYFILLEIFLCIGLSSWYVANEDWRWGILGVIIPSLMLILLNGVQIASFIKYTRPRSISVKRSLYGFIAYFVFGIFGCFIYLRDDDNRQFYLYFYLVSFLFYKSLTVAYIYDKYRYEPDEADFGDEEFCSE